MYPKIISTIVTARATSDSGPTEPTTKQDFGPKCAVPRSIFDMVLNLTQGIDNIKHT